MTDHRPGSQAIGVPGVVVGILGQDEGEIVGPVVKARSRKLS